MHLLIALFLTVIINEGPIIDPNGGRPPAVRGETGSCVDPNGHPIPCVQGGTGTCIDPNGARCSRGLATASTGEWPWQG